MVAVINNFGGFYQSWVYFNEARRWGGHIELPCINHSEYLTSIDGNTIFIGFVHIESLETTLAHQIVEERRRNDPTTTWLILWSVPMPASHKR